MKPTKTLYVFLNETAVGVLTQVFDGRTFMAFSESYTSDLERPVLSLSYKTIANDLKPILEDGSVGLPPFFAHLLPEGRLKRYLAQRAGVRETQEFQLLSALKNDLPGAVVLKAEDNDEALGSRASELADSEHEASKHALRFSLAGVQMKFSGDFNNEKLSIPVRGIGAETRHTKGRIRADT